MKKYAHNVVAIVLGLLTVALAAKSVAINRDTAMLRLQIAAKRQQAAQQQQALQNPLQQWEMITAKQVMDGLVAHYKLPIKVEIDKSVVKLIPITPDAKDVSSKPQYEVLKDYKALLGFMSALATIPYKFEVKELCIGTDCNGGFSMSADLKNKTPNS